MDSKILNDIINDHADKFRELAEETAKHIMKPLKEVDFEDNDDLKTLHARLKEIYIGHLNYACVSILFHNMKADIKWLSIQSVDL